MISNEPSHLTQIQNSRHYAKVGKEDPKALSLVYSSSYESILNKPLFSYRQEVYVCGRQIVNSMRVFVLPDGRGSNWRLII